MLVKITTVKSTMAVGRCIIYKMSKTNNLLYLNAHLHEKVGGTKVALPWNIPSVWPSCCHSVKEVSFWYKQFLFEIYGFLYKDMAVKNMSFIYYGNSYMAMVTCLYWKKPRSLLNINLSSNFCTLHVTMKSTIVNHDRHMLDGIHCYSNFEETHHSM